MTPRLDVELFEIVPVNAGTVLLRLEGRWYADAREPLPMPTLVVDDGRRSQRLASLPGPDATPPQAGPDAELWRASYPTPATLLQDDARIVFALDAGRGIIVDLPAPAPRGQGRRFSRSSVAELAHERTLRAQAELLADERRRALRDAEANLDRERAARAAEALRADTAESDLARVGAELESQRDHARADAAQRARDGEVAAGALAVAQARVRELDEALAAQRRRALEAESGVQSAQAETDARVALEQARAGEAVAAQRALAEEATRAQVAAQTQAREHAARAADLERARDALRLQLEDERERLRALQAKEVAEETIEERRRSREQQARTETAESRLRQVTAELVTLAEERAHLQAELAEAHARIEALEATPAPVEPVARVESEPAAPEPGPGPVPRPALLAVDQPTVAFSLPPEEDAPADIAAPEPPAAVAAPDPDPPPAVVPEEEPSHAVSVFGPFGDAGRDRPEPADPVAPVAEPEPAPPPEHAPDLPPDPDPQRQTASEWLDRHIPDRPAWAEHDVPQYEPHPPPEWNADDFDLSFDLPPQQTAAGRRAARLREGDASLVAYDEPARGRRGRARGGDVERRSTTPETRRAILLGVVLAAAVLVGLRVAGVIGAITMASL